MKIPVPQAISRRVIGSIVLITLQRVHIGFRSGGAGCVYSQSIYHALAPEERNVLLKDRIMLLLDRLLRGEFKAASRSRLPPHSKLLILARSISKSPRLDF